MINIVYINGYKGKNSSKAKILKEKYNATHIVLEDEFNPNEVCQKLQELEPDIIIASSTGCYVADSCSYDKGVFIYLNPLVDLDDLKKIADITNLKNLSSKEKNRVVLVNQDDELLDYKKTVEHYENVKIFENGGHRFKNLEDLVEIINKLK